MRFTRSRAVLRTVRSANLRRDLEDLVGVIDKTVDRRTAGRQASLLMNMAVRLDRTLPHRTRLAIVDAVIDDATRAEVPHQWERKEGYECGAANDCSKPNPDTTCRHDTSGPSCISG